MGHTRKGKQVQSYIRGKGVKQTKLANPTPMVKRAGTPYPKNKYSKQVYLSEGGMVDKGIYPYIEKINVSGFGTVASCSGLKADHYGRKEGAYLSVEIPEDKVTSEGLLLQDDPFYVPKKNILDKEWVDNMIQAGLNSGWLAKLSVYMMIKPVIRYSLPVTKHIGADLAIQNNPKVISAQQEIDRATGGKPDIFLAAIHKRDAIKKELYSKYDTNWTDKEIKERWNTLTITLSKLNPKTGEMK